MDDEDRIKDLVKRLVKGQIPPPLLVNLLLVKDWLDDNALLKAFRCKASGMGLALLQFLNATYYSDKSG